MQKNYFIARESSHYFGQINNIPYVDGGISKKSIFNIQLIILVLISVFSTFSIGEGYP